MALSNKVQYSSLSLWNEVVERVVGVKQSLELKNNSQAVQVLLAAYDIINSTGHGGRFTEAVKSAFEEGRTS